MTHFPRSPRVRKGAIVTMAPSGQSGGAKVIAFQYNPYTLTRTLTAQMSDEGGASSEVFRFKGPPQEQISVEVEIDATDQLERGEKDAISMGIYPQLSALEMILYPNSDAVVASRKQSKDGWIEVKPTEAPLTLFVWGTRRVLPVRLSSFSITEEAYDVNLNPIRAKVSLTMQVLSYTDLPTQSPGHDLFMTYMQDKEKMAEKGSTTQSHLKFDNIY